MAMGKRQSQQQPLFVVASNLPQSVAHPFYSKLNEVLAGWKFDAFVEERCKAFYDDKMGRPSLAPGIYFRILLVGFFEGIDSERGIAWRCADSLSIRSFVGLALDQQSPDHSTISRNRRLIDAETHKEVFQWALKVLADYDLISGKTIGVDATTLEANAAMRSIVRKDTKQSYQDYLTELAKASGIETPTREDLSKIDRKRKNKASNDDWENPHDPDAKIAKMKDGSTHLAHKAEHAVDMETGAVLAVTIQDGHLGDTTSILETIAAATENLSAVADDCRVEDKIHDDIIEEVVADKGYHSNNVAITTKEMGIRSYIAEPQRGQRNWSDVPEEIRDSVYDNRRRIKGERGKSLMRKRGELIERSFAHCYETGAMRRTHLRGHENISKRVLIHTAGFNLSLIMRQLIGFGKPRCLQGLLACIFSLILALWVVIQLSVKKFARSKWFEPIYAN